jgi:hypothetical protein
VQPLGLNKFRGLTCSVTLEEGRQLLLTLAVRYNCVNGQTYLLYPRGPA